MEFLESFSNHAVVTLYWLAGLSVFFALATALLPCNPGMYFWKDKRATITDLLYWLVIPVVGVVIKLGLLITCAHYILGFSAPEDMEHFMLHGYGVLSSLPLWVQVPLLLLLSDFFMYWLHRLFHTQELWDYHAIHHSPQTLDWMSTARFHPINYIFYAILVDVCMLLIGFAPAAFALLAPFNRFFSAFVHANLNISFGRFKYMLASPVFHRWHHTKYSQGGMKNFAPTFPFIDVMFGTFYMPEGAKPEVYGDKKVPKGFWAQIIYPFRHIGKKQDEAKALMELQPAKLNVDETHP